MNKESIKSDLARIDRMRDEDIDYSDIPSIDSGVFAFAMPPKKQLTIRLDADVLDWVKRHGRGYQTRINRILRVVMESQPPSPASKNPKKRPVKRRVPARPKARTAKRRSVS